MVMFGCILVGETGVWEIIKKFQFGNSAAPTANLCFQHAKVFNQHAWGLYNEANLSIADEKFIYASLTDFCFNYFLEIKIFGR